MYHLMIVTPNKVVFENWIYSLMLPGELGYLEILSNHAPIMTVIKPGKLVITSKNGQQITYAISHGILEMSSNHCTVLADAIEAISEIDIERARKAVERARRRLESQSIDLNISRAISSLHRAENRLKLYNETLPKFNAYSPEKKTGQSA